MIKMKKNIYDASNKNEHINQENTIINLLTMSQLTKSEERRSLHSNVKDHFPLTCINDKLLKPSQYIELLLQNEDT